MNEQKDAVIVITVEQLNTLLEKQRRICFDCAIQMFPTGSLTYERDTDYMYERILEAPLPELPAPVDLFPSEADKRMEAEDRFHGPKERFAFEIGFGCAIDYIKTKLKQ
jgi:hypothetical protein